MQRWRQHNSMEWMSPADERRQLQVKHLGDGAEVGAVPDLDTVVVS
jgi:hypothetical protein